MPKFFSTNSRSSGQPKNNTKTFVSTLHCLSLVIFATAAVLAIVLLHNSRFNFHCYTQREATPTQKSAQKWHCDLLRLLAWKITKGIHLCKPSSLNHPIESSGEIKRTEVELGFPLLQVSTATFQTLSLCLCSAQLLKQQLTKYTSCFALVGSPPP